jgi:hypothetical protein
MRKGRAHAGRQTTATLAGFRGAWRVLGVLVLATVALGVLSIQAVRREAVARRNLVVDAHRGVADLVSARLSANLAEDQRVVAAAVAAGGQHANALVDALGGIEAARPWMRPLVLVASTDRDPASSAGVGLSESSARATAFDALLHAAEREELVLRRFDVAIGLYARAEAGAPSPTRRLEALNGMARTEFKAGRPGRRPRSPKSLPPPRTTWTRTRRDGPCSRTIG